MLSEEEKQAFVQSVSQVQTLATKALTQSQHAAQSIQFVHQLHRGVDAASAKASTLSPKVACAEGCSHCCVGKRVEVSVPEALYIAKQLQSLPTTAFEQTITKLKSFTENSDKPQACTFLNHHRCTIYDIRPAVCRKAHSQSAEACASGTDSIPQHLQLILETEALMTGTSQAYEGIGLSAERLELNQALLTALTNPMAESDWYQTKN